jgi:UDP-N-acetylmuramate--alanine ligase
MSLDLRGRHVHLLGIGGSGVSALVPLLQGRGAVVSGCDSAESAVTQRLVDAGIPVAVGHAATHLAGVDLVIHSAAIASDHPELVAARAQGIRVVPRGACLVELMAGARTLAISGSHGKTSTTWFAGHLLTRGGADPVVMVGGAVGSLGGGARVGRGDIFVAEVDESDGSFAGVRPLVAVVTNLDHEHLRHYGSFAALEAAFQAWLATVPAHGLIIAPAHGLGAQVTVGLAAPVLRVGLEAGDCHVAGLELGAEGSLCRVILHGEDLGEISVPIPGAHMVANALMAIAATRFLHSGIDLADLATCERVRRRFLVHGTVGGVRVVEDYGHHPAEVRATIAAARLGGGRVHVLFQPHRHTRTADCFAEFVTAFDQAQSVAMLPIYGAGEDPIPGVTSAAVVAAIATRRSEDATDQTASVAAPRERVAASAWIAARAQTGDTILILGAGDVGECAQGILAFFRPGRDEPAMTFAPELLHVCA